MKHVCSIQYFIQVFHCTLVLLGKERVWMQALGQEKSLHRKGIFYNCHYCSSGTLLLGYAEIIAVCVSLCERVSSPRAWPFSALDSFRSCLPLPSARLSEISDRCPCLGTLVVVWSKPNVASIWQACRGNSLQHDWLEGGIGTMTSRWPISFSSTGESVPSSQLPQHREGLQPWFNFRNLPVNHFFFITVVASLFFQYFLLMEKCKVAGPFNAWKDLLPICDLGSFNYNRWNNSINLQVLCF